MLAFPVKGEPGTVEQMIAVTRENRRTVDDYDVVLSNFGLPRIPGAPTAILEIGTGQGNALSGLHERSGSQTVVSCDIDESALVSVLHRVPESRLARLRDLDGRLQPSRGVTLLLGDLGGRASPVFAPSSFSLALSIWVFYQILNKARVLGHILAGLEPGARAFLVSSGYVAIVPDSLNSALEQRLRRFVWNHRARRFGWLTGHRELAEVARSEGVRLIVEPFVDFIERLTPGLCEVRGRDLEELPAGHAVLRAPDDETAIQAMAARLLEVEEVGYVSTRNSAFIPFYCLK